ncbi:hypothetical protein FQN54_007999 [Arachnomyces sp. PD_36]|nr:hypothetical protein FQN54_007999 [Arachnomyces sp. PD_36]
MAPAKAKAQKMALGAFLTDENFGSWADEMDEMPLSTQESRTTGYGGERRAFSSNAGFGSALGGDRERGGYSVREQLPLPTQPPYTAHIGNLSFEATSTDISDLFADCEVTNVRVVEDKMTRSPKGFGYVEFGSLDGLKKALEFSGTALQGRNIRVSVAEPPKDRQESRDFSDWSRKGPLPDLPSQRRVSDRPGFGSRNQDNLSDAGSDRPGRRTFEPAADAGKSRDFGNWERKGPLSPSASVAPAGREGGRPRTNDGPQFRKSSPAWGEGRSQDGSRPPPKREYQERPAPERTPTAPELDNQWRSRMRPDAPAKPPVSPREPSNPPSPAAPPAPAVRPKLNLQKRTVSEVDPNAPATDVKASPFAGARPIDTSAREREVEERHQLAVRQKKEADEKAKAEKAEKAKQAKEQAKEQAKDASKGGADANGAKDDSADTAQGGKNFEILRRAGEEETGMAADVDVDASAAKAPAAGKAPAAPRGPAAQQTAGKQNGNWRSGGAQASQRAEAAPTDEDGWSTVSSKPRNNRRGGGRGYAS